MIRILIYILSLIIPFTAYCVDVDIEEDLEQSEEQERIAPEIDADALQTMTNIEIPSYIDRAKNSIIYNGADWAMLHSNMANLKNHNADADNVVMLHIGDSHIQADIATRRVREQLQLNYGNAGRGLITPFKLAKTNEPVDYSIKTNSSFNYATLLRKPWSVDVGFTGVALRPNGKEMDLTISTLPTQLGVSPFDVVKIYHDSEIDASNITIDGVVGGDSSFNDIGGTVITLPHEQTSVDLSISYSQQAPRIFGIELSRANSGVVYNTIGNNGATYSHYNDLSDFGQWLSLLTPQLVIVSLGCNEAFGNMTNETFYNHVDRFVKTITNNIPDAVIMLTTPMECQRAFTTTVRRGRGKKKRRVRVRKYAVNNKVATLRKEILRYGKNNNIAVWDWYQVAGGAGASTDWLNDKHLGRDRIHCTASGYQLQGELLYEALTKNIK